jgi:hypothetical protein
MRKKKRPATMDGAPRTLPGTPYTRGVTWAVIYNPSRRAFFDGGERWTRDLSQAIERPLQYGEVLLAVDGEYYMLPKRARRWSPRAAGASGASSRCCQERRWTSLASRESALPAPGRCFTCCGEIAKGRVASTVRAMT